MSAKIPSIPGSGKTPIPMDQRSGGMGDIHDHAGQPDQSLHSHKIRLKFMEKVLDAKDHPGTSKPNSEDKWVVDRIVDALVDGVAGMFLAGKLKKKFGESFTPEEKESLRSAQVEMKAILGDVILILDLRGRKPAKPQDTSPPQTGTHPDPLEIQIEKIQKRAGDIKKSMEKFNAAYYTPERKRIWDLREITVKRDDKEIREFKPFMRDGMLLHIRAQNVYADAVNRAAETADDSDSLRILGEHHDKHLKLADEWQKFFLEGQLT